MSPDLARARGHPRADRVAIALVIRVGRGHEPLDE